jgi:hypothetical protein
VEKEMHQTCLWKRFKFLEKFGNVNSLASKLQSSPNDNEVEKLSHIKKNPCLQKYKGIFFIFSIKQL